MLQFITARCCSCAGWPVQDVLERGRWVAPTPQDIVNSYRGGGGGVKLRAEDIILQVWVDAGGEGAAVGEGEKLCW